MVETHLITGATGFVGSALVLELLRTTDVRVVCLVRPHGDEAAARRRLEEVLVGVAHAYDIPEVAELLPQRCRVVAGDLCAEGCGVEPEQIGPIDEVWHSAASLRFEDAYRDAIFAQNVDGTRRALALARAVGSAKFNHISTAYVAGSRTGVIREELEKGDGHVNNVYEQTKIQGEKLVAGSGLDYRILRPSIVIGHSKTAAVINPSGFYAFTRKLAHLRKWLVRRGELQRAREFEILGNPEAPLNLIPVDAVAAAAVRICRSRSKDRIFHLTNAQPPQLGRAMADVTAEIGLDGLLIVPSLSSTAPETEHLNRAMTFFLSYLTAPKEFDRTHTDAVLGSEASCWPIDEEGLRRYVRWFLENPEGNGRKRAAK